MKRFKTEQGIDIGIGEQFEHAGVRYPANWTALASPQDLARIGMTVHELPDAVKSDDEDKAENKPAHDNRPVSEPVIPMVE